MLNPRLSAASGEFLDVLIRAGLIVALVIFCYEIFHPFLSVMLWAIILAVMLYPLNMLIARRLHLSSGKAAILLVLVGLSILIVPMVFLGESVATSVQRAMHFAQDWTPEIPPPAASVQDWPLIGDKVFAIWTHASTDMTWAIQEVAPHLKSFSTLILLKLAGVGRGIIVFILALIIAGFFMAYGEAAGRRANAIAARIFSPERGPELAVLCTSTIRAVAQGVVGIAFIQMLMVGVSLIIMGIPAAGLLALMVLLLGIMQLPTFLVTVPIIIYVFMQEGAGFATIVFAIWNVLAGLSDNVLKPLLLGRGVAVPMPVILIGALGGMITNGIIGLFIGPVILAIGYELFNSWVDAPARPAPLDPALVETRGTVSGPLDSHIPPTPQPEP
jgi:predicted PurR-regulated permease PerM